MAELHIIFKKASTQTCKMLERVFYVNFISIVLLTVTFPRMWSSDVLKTLLKIYIKSNEIIKNVIFP